MISLSAGCHALAGGAARRPHHPRMDASSPLDAFAKRPMRTACFGQRPWPPRVGRAVGGPTDASFSPQEVTALTLRALQDNDSPSQFGHALLRRFSSSDFACRRAAAGQRQAAAPPELTSFFASTQYNLLLEPSCYSQWSFPSETCSFDDSEAGRRSDSRPSPMAAARIRSWPSWAGRSCATRRLLVDG